MAVAALAGLMRGFSGFGGAMIYMPLIAAIYDPRIAAVTILLVDFVSATPFAIPEVRRCTWREVRRCRSPWRWACRSAPGRCWCSIRSCCAGASPRWCSSLVPVLASGWRYHGAPRLPITLGVGLFSGVSAGAVLIAGPPVILYWLGGGSIGEDLARQSDGVLHDLRRHPGRDLRLCQPVRGAPAGAVGAARRSLSRSAWASASHFFHGASERLYRSIAYVIIALAALVSLPLFDFDPALTASSDAAR